MVLFEKIKKRLGRRAAFVLLLVLLALAVTAVGFVFAKYISLLDVNEPITSSDFYFESDLLSSSSSPYYTLMAGVDEIRFELKNHPDALRHADCDITYRATLTKAGVEIDAKTGYLTVTASEKFITSEVVFLGLEPGVYTVTATATAPYVATLSARFEIVATVEDIEWSVSDVSGSPFASLTVKTVDYEGCLKITWPLGTQPEPSEPLMEGATGQSHTVDFAKNSEYVFTFFKTNPAAVFTKADFEVEKAPTP